MKFKKLSEAFDYDQAALNHAKDLIDELSSFVDNVDMYKHATEFIDSDDIEALNIAIEVLDSFLIRYGAFASKQLRDNINKG